MEGPPEDNLTMEVRDEEMISPLNGDSSLRIAHFLRPSVTFIDGPVSDPPLDSVNPTMIESSVHLKVNFAGWRHPQKEWKTWVNRMQSLHHSTWRQAAIHDAIINSTFEIHRNTDLILGVAEKWCSKTNTFVFPWGEATITLEDMMVLGCFSVLGDSVWSPTGDIELEMTVDKLHKARSDITRGKSKKAIQSAWMVKFMDCGSKIEHEAFLAHWLSRFVFPVYDCDTIGRTVLPVAVRLAKGTKIALAPAVLATIYKNLSSLKGALVASRKLGTREGKNVHEVKLTAPLQLVQAWVWERFLALRPKPNSTKLGEPRLARWHDLKKVGTMNVSLAIDRAAKDFTWRPYMRAENSSLPHMIYKEKDYWVSVDSCLGDEFEGLVRCLRTSELVGLEVGCIEQYLPHRVAMQFGMDQDLPGCVARVNERTASAWSNYTRTIGDAILYIPARLFESDVTTRYMKWWKKLRFARSGMTETRKGKSTSRFEIEEIKGFSKMKSMDDALAPPSSIHPKPTTTKAGVSGIKDNIVGKFFKEEGDGIRLPQKDTQRKSALSCANDGTKDDFHGNSISETSKREVMEIISGKKSDKDGTTKAGSEGNTMSKGHKREEMEGFFKMKSVDDVLAPPPPSFPPKPNSTKAGVSGIKDNIVGKIFKEESNGIRLSQKDTQMKSALSCANDGIKDDFHGNSISETSKRGVMEIISGKKSDKDGTTKAGSEGNTTSKGHKREEMEGFFKMKSVDGVLAPPPGFPPKPNSTKAGVSGIKDIIVGKFFKEESDGIRLPQKDTQMKSALSCANDGTKGDFHGNSISEMSKREVMEIISGKKSGTDVTTNAGSDAKSVSNGSKREETEGFFKMKSVEDVLAPPPGFPPKPNSMKAGVSCIKDNSIVGKIFKEESNVIRLPQKDAQRKITLSCAIDGNKDDFQGHDISERSKRKVTESLSGKKSIKDALVPPPLGFSPKRTRVEAGDSGFKDKERGVEMFVVESDVNSQPQDEPAEPELENKSAGPKNSELENKSAVNYRSEGHAESCSQTTHEAPGMGLDERICTIEKLCAWLKAGNCSLGDIKFCKRST